MNLNNLQGLLLRDNDCIDACATNREAVIALANRLSILCPPLSTTEGTTTEYCQQPP